MLSIMYSVSISMQYGAFQSCLQSYSGHFKIFQAHGASFTDTRFPVLQSMVGKYRSQVFKTWSIQPQTSTVWGWISTSQNIHAFLGGIQWIMQFGCLNSTPFVPLEGQAFLMPNGHRFDIAEVSAHSCGCRSPRPHRRRHRWSRRRRPRRRRQRRRRRRRRWGADRAWVEDNFCHGYGKIWFTWDLHPKNEVYLNGTQWWCNGDAELSRTNSRLPANLSYSDKATERVLLAAFDMGISHHFRRKISKFVHCIYIYIHIYIWIDMDIYWYFFNDAYN